MTNYGAGPPKKMFKEGSTRPQCKGVSTGPNSAGTPHRCPWEELPDLGYCWYHAPDDLIPEAERLTGIRRCTDITAGNPFVDAQGHRGERCGNPVYPGADKCKHHGGVNKKNGPERREAFEAILDGKALEILPSVVNSGRPTGGWMPPPPPGTPPGKAVPPGPPAEPVQNPFIELLQVAGEMKQFKDRLAEYVANMTVEQWRYEHDRAGEQVDANIVLYAQSMERLSVCLTRIAKLNIEERMLKISERQVEIIENAIGRTLKDLGLPPTVEKQARTAVVRRLRAA